jgi:hypothetical protein
VSGLREYLARKAAKDARARSMTSWEGMPPSPEEGFVLRDRRTGEVRGTIVIEYDEPSPSNSEDKP